MIYTPSLKSVLCNEGRQSLHKHTFTKKMLCLTSLGLPWASSWRVGATSYKGTGAPRGRKHQLSFWKRNRWILYLEYVVHWVIWLSQRCSVPPQEPARVLICKNVFISEKVTGHHRKTNWEKHIKIHAGKNTHIRGMRAHREREMGSKRQKAWNRERIRGRDRQILRETKRDGKGPR